MIPSRQHTTERAMTRSMIHDEWAEQADEPEVRIDGRVDPQREDAYWQRAYWAEPYYRADFGYDDYARPIASAISAVRSTAAVSRTPRNPSAPTGCASRAIRA
jgi:hypothetical protein